MFELRQPAASFPAECDGIVADLVAPTPFATFVDGLPADGWCIYDIVVHFDGGGLTTLASKENLKLEATLDTLMQEKTAVRKHTQETQEVPLIAVVGPSPPSSCEPIIGE